MRAERRVNSEAGAAVADAVEGLSVEHAARDYGGDSRRFPLETRCEVIAGTGEVIGKYTVRFRRPTRSESRGHRRAILQRWLTPKTRVDGGLIRISLVEAMYSRKRSLVEPARANEPLVSLRMLSAQRSQFCPSPKTCTSPFTGLAGDRFFLRLDERRLGVRVKSSSPPR